MPARPQEAPLIAVHNNLETFFKFLQRSEDPDVFRKRRHRGERGIFWLGDPKLLFVTAASPAAEQVCRRWGYPGTQVLEPAEPTPQLSLDILHEPQLLQCILAYAGPERTLRLVPYATTSEFLQLAAELRSRGLTVLLPECPAPENLWLRDYADSKSGFRALAAECLEEADVCPQGFVCRDVKRAAAAVDWFLRQGRTCVVKADGGESGIGHALFAPESAREPALETLQRNPFLRDDLILVEEYVHSPQGLSPSLEFFVPPAGQGCPQVTYVSQQTFSDFGRFAGVMVSRTLEQADWYPVLHRRGTRLAARLQALGYVGHFDLDAVVDERGDPRLLEINARRTGGTYVHEFARHTFGADYLQKAALLSQNALPSGGIFELEPLLERLSGLLYPDYGPGSGVVVTVTSTLSGGEFGCILVAPDEAGLLQLNRRMLERLQQPVPEGMA
jgi:hypothetical protein